MVNVNNEAETLSLEEKFKAHIHFEEGMDDSMLSFYLNMAKNYVKTATGGQEEYLILMVAGIAYEYRVSEDELDKALNAITPFIIQGVIQHAEKADE
ncbi:head-tail connector protein [Enterococcus faecalis]|uniref:head-tail connector protein n=1 Tax=Enterococcus faecalis TaxID=1351 RepID=UPI0013DF2F2E|nr:head-tail connector protein [Enterococcus faecalis]EHD3760728.1 phage gp6-like head-tail connector protein [Enterococcus faecalis]EHQ9017598.1 phage gp6-like head-tail connector protein [Enterococcus faecalis]EHQ9028058.1 phage gp6-like head-tail connector protein [Enterococcus faecalis]MCD5128054.1 phage gp6-like head-tail connector protein [Enterococcus faecalis]MCD5149829.1 phage gp6-like head-tail connector protein [Enterococcus faecalis]